MSTIDEFKKIEKQQLDIATKIAVALFKNDKTTEAIDDLLYLMRDDDDDDDNYDRYYLSVNTLILHIIRKIGNDIDFDTAKLLITAIKSNSEDNIRYAKDILYYTSLIMEALQALKNNISIDLDSINKFDDIIAIFYK